MLPREFNSAFHPTINAAYVVNELSSTVSVYEFNAVEARGLKAGDARPTLRFAQSVSTIPSAFPRKLNTCGRICVDPTGRCVCLFFFCVCALRMRRLCRHCASSWFVLLS